MCVLQTPPSSPEESGGTAGTRQQHLSIASNAHLLSLSCLCVFLDVCVCSMTICTPVSMTVALTSDTLTPPTCHKCKICKGLGFKVISALSSRYCYQLECLFSAGNEGMLLADQGSTQKEIGLNKYCEDFDKTVCYSSRGDQIILSNTP